MAPNKVCFSAAVDLCFCVFRFSLLPSIATDLIDLRFAWYHPLDSPEQNFRAGRKKKILDIFGPWGPSDTLPLTSSETLPSVMQPHQKVLLWDFEPEIDEKNAEQVTIPFSVLDQVMDIHHIDITGLSMSSTKRGNLYRTHRLMIPVG